MRALKFEKNLTQKHELSLFSWCHLKTIYHPCRVEAGREPKCKFFFWGWTHISAARSKLGFLNIIRGNSESAELEVDVHLSPVPSMLAHWLFQDGPPRWLGWLSLYPSPTSSRWLVLACSECRQRPAGDSEAPAFSTTDRLNHTTTPAWRNGSVVPGLSHPEGPVCLFT